MGFKKSVPSAQRSRLGDVSWKDLPGGLSIPQKSKVLQSHKQSNNHGISWLSIINIPKLCHVSDDLVALQVSEQVTCHII